ncbi:MAG TPA: DUF5667 domain-containing protein [Patescibacteria group bacterium]|nr:DUF5667 domain-containing protein [Patescibacteria group bacterium]
MKKIFFLVYSVFIFLFFLGSPVFAENATSSATIDYQLPYPGILADNPLYNLKTLRDRIIDFFISDPLKKSEFDLLQADKRLSVGIALFDKGKQDLSETTISKGENYFEEALKNAKVVKGQGGELDAGFLTNLEQSSRKHEQVVKDLAAKSSGNVKKGFEKTLQRIEGFKKSAIELKPS